MTATSEVLVEPALLAFGRVYVGQKKQLTTVVRNGGRAGVSVSLTVDAPFVVAPAEVTLAGGEEASVTVSLVAVQPGPLSATLRVGSSPVAVSAEVVSVPDCVKSSPCRAVRFDVTTETCVETDLSEGAACVTSCVSAGVCSSGDCIGEAASCADQSACTLDVCGGSGCRQLPRECPAPTDPCQAATCDPATGCGSEPVPDGTLCGPDDCLATQLDVCIAGRCVQRVRPATGRCTNTWVTTGVTPGTMALDEARGLTVTHNFETWTFDGQRWTRRTPAQVPTVPGPMVYDAARKRVVLFGCDFNARAPCETWEWDGVTWVRRVTTTAPETRARHMLAYDSARQRTVLFGGSVNTTSGFSNQTWEWDGRTWVLRQLPASPPETASGSLAYDPVRRRIVLFGGQIFVGNGSAGTSATWEYDGVTWVRVADGPPRSSAAMSFDVTTRRMLVQGGRDFVTGGLATSTWAWDGSTWAEVAMAGPAFPSMVSMPDGGALALDSSAATWRWDGARWHLVVPREAPVFVEAAAYDAERQGIVCWEFGKAWLWTGDTFLDAGVGPASLRAPKLFFDEVRRQTVAVGGLDGADAGTWWWSGAAWNPGPTVVFDSYWTETAAATFDSDRQVGLVVSRYGTHEYVDGGWRALGALGVPANARLNGVGLSHDTVRATSVLLISGQTFERSDGGLWRLSPATGGTGSGPLMAFDERARGVVTLGATPAGAGAVMRMFDGQSWRTMTPGRLPPVEIAAGVMAYHRARGQLTLIQGPVVWVYLP
jgi:hypothetical protein